MNFYMEVCPRCGSRSVLCKTAIADANMDYVIHYVGCTLPECMVQGPLGRTPEVAVSRWNEGWNGRRPKS